MYCRSRAFRNGRQTVTIAIRASSYQGDPNSSEPRHRTYIVCVVPYASRRLHCPLLTGTNQGWEPEAYTVLLLNRDIRERAFGDAEQIKTRSEMPAGFALKHM